MSERRLPSSSAAASVVENTALAARPCVAADTAPRYDVKVAAVVLELRELARQASLDLAFSVGKLVIQRFYGGKLELWRRRGRKSASLRALGQHPDVPFSAAAIYRAIALYDLSERLGGISTWKHLAPSHFRAVLPLPEPEQARHLQMAEEHEWTVARLERAVAENQPWARRGGRPRLPKCLKSLRALKRFSEGASDLLLDVDELRLLGDGERRELAATAASLSRKLAELEAALERDLDSGDRSSGVFPSR